MPQLILIAFYWFCILKFLGDDDDDDDNNDDDNDDDDDDDDVKNVMMKCPQGGFISEKLK